MKTVLSRKCALLNAYAEKLLRKLGITEIGGFVGKGWEVRVEEGAWVGTGSTKGLSKAI